MEDIVLVHRTSAKSLALAATLTPTPTPKPFAPDILVWKTCLRQIAFVAACDVASIRSEDDEVLEGSEAFAFLLEVICGLRSPVVGETEVFGQFKNFVVTANHHQHLRPFFQALIQAAKSLRAEHLVGLGSQGYGSLVRKLSKTDMAVTLLGSGQLTEEILPWLVKAKKTQVVSRNSARALELKKAYSSLEVAELTDASTPVHACLVVAAPLSDEELLQWLERRPGQVRKILDLRGELEDATVFENYHFIGLKDVFANIEKNKSDLESKVQQLKQIVLVRAQEHYERILYRPFGWEDLCV